MLPAASARALARHRIYRHDGPFSDPNDASRSPFATEVESDSCGRRNNPMMVGLKRISTVVGLLAVTASAAFGQGTVANPNQMTADSVASALRASRTLSGSRIEIEAQDGLVTLTGTLANPALKAEARGASPAACRAFRA